MKYEFNLDTTSNPSLLPYIYYSILDSSDNKGLEDEEFIAM